tara:strand:+ start:332 stop:631 length:300 start_codon:yes stop_codon:yes gene_type:complete
MTEQKFTIEPEIIDDIYYQLNAKRPKRKSQNLFEENLIKKGYLMGYTECEWRKNNRPKPPRLKEQALAALDDAIMRGDCITISDALPTLRRALEALPND